MTTGGRNPTNRSAREIVTADLVVWDGVRKLLELLLVAGLGLGLTFSCGTSPSPQSPTAESPTASSPRLSPTPLASPSLVTITFELTINGTVPSGDQSFVLEFPVPGAAQNGFVICTSYFEGQACKGGGFTTVKAFHVSPTGQPVPYQFGHSTANGTTVFASGTADLTRNNAYAANYSF
jgi:hypothetical protein